MCGIVGMVGCSKNPITSYALTTNLLRETMRRGKHATGYFSVTTDGQTQYDKAPSPANQYIKRIEWKRNIRGTQALIGHCRFTTQGSAQKNENNHPFISQNGNIALVHNGIIFQYDDVKADYNKALQSECDSELILRIICREKDIIRGIKKVFTLLGPGGDFACELIHKQENGQTMFYFFRDANRPGKMIDAKSVLGQIFFCSEEAIWKDAVSKSGMNKIVSNLEIKDVEPYQIIAIDAQTLKTNIIKVPKQEFSFVKKPVYQRPRYTPPYTPPYSYHHYSTEPVARTFQARNEIKSVLNPAQWIETKNEKGLPKFYYYPDKITPQTRKQEDDFIVSTLKRAISDPSQRFPGWVEEAYDYDLITIEEYERFSAEEICKGEELTSQSDDKYLAYLTHEPSEETEN